MKIRDILDERKINPINLANRVGKRYGTEKDYGYYSSDTVPGDYIPLKSYNDDWVNEMELVFNDVYKSFDFYNLSAADRVKVRLKLDNEAKSIKSLPINKLSATQPFVRIEDREILKKKVSSSKDIVVIKFADHFFIRDGHHAVLAARLRGEKQIKAEVIDLDYLEEKYL